MSKFIIENQRAKKRVNLNVSQTKKKMVKIPKKSVTHKHSSDQEILVALEATQRRESMMRNQMVTDQTPSLKELLKQDFSASKSNDDEKPVFIPAQTSKRRNLHTNTQGSHNAGGSFIFDQFQDMDDLDQVAATSHSRIQ